jgi:hypothetical protein
MNRRNMLAVSAAAAAVAALPFVAKSGTLRLSADPNDPGFDAFIEARAAKKNIHVFLNGNELDTSIIGIADERLGCVESLQRDAAGEIRVEHGDFVIGRLYGRVRIELRNNS